ncbi:hypothetical protein [Alkalihalobacterium elongatum]|uniref:hypothetical protein n=1 Tax=Alkalihalobacterium elongatum TaxID=2675466 RepID=UPI001C1FC16F|nr:hypothetical protein [Alkalihalobacterium elongatum]
MNLYVLTIISPLVFLLYQVIIDFVDLFPFNDIKARDKRLRKFEILGNYPPLIIIALCFYYNTSWSVWVGFGLTSIILIMHVFAWWFPYFTGYPKTVRKDYEQYFMRTYKFLPKIKNHIVPDAEHVGVGVLLLVTFIVQAMYLFG